MRMLFQFWCIYFFRILISITKQMKSLNQKTAYSRNRLRTGYPYRVASADLNTHKEQEDMMASMTVLLWIIAIGICVISYLIGVGIK